MPRKKQPYFALMLVEDIDGQGFEVAEIRATDHGWPICLGHPRIDGHVRRQPQVILTQQLADYLLAHDVWRAGVNLPIGPRAIKDCRDRLGVTLSGLVAERWRKAQEAGGSQDEIAERAGCTRSASQFRGISGDYPSPRRHRKVRGF